MQRLKIDQYIQERLDDQLKYYSKAANNAKRKYQNIKVAEIAFAAMIPFLSALITPDRMYVKFIVGVLGVFVTLFSGMLMLYKYHEEWVNYRSTEEALKSEKYLFLAQSGPYKNGANAADFIERIESILGNENQKWQQYASKEVGKQAAATGENDPDADSVSADEAGQNT
jgi:hypothetical protein